MWLCRGSDRIFTVGTGSVLSFSKLGVDVSSAYVEGMVEGLPLRKLAERCGVYLKTSRHVCMRACSVTRSRLAPFRCDRGTSVQIDEKRLNESLTRNRDTSRIGAVVSTDEPGFDVAALSDARAIAHSRHNSKYAGEDDSVAHRIPTGSVRSLACRNLV